MVKKRNEYNGHYLRVGESYDFMIFHIFNGRLSFYSCFFSSDIALLSAVEENAHTAMRAENVKVWLTIFFCDSKVASWRLGPLYPSDKTDISVFFYSSYKTHRLCSLKKNETQEHWKKETFLPTI